MPTDADPGSHISGVLVACRPEHLERLSGRIEAHPWAEVHHRDERGRLVVTIEAADVDQSVERLQGIQRLPGVLLAEMVELVVDDDEGRGGEPS